ncbi:MAG: hypothetical protein HZA54_07775 [Planctomycetes bacterium]|nr:hypothetical protein [Planctomycetota bacterium]
MTERRALPGMDPTRADILPAGLTVLALAAARLGAERFAISWTGLRHGLVAVPKWPISPRVEKFS